MVDMACWDSLERDFHEEFNDGILIVIHRGSGISVYSSNRVKVTSIKLMHIYKADVQNAFVSLLL